jgi:pyridinium-3,5-biscarboxylic acid mononucleotide sulfurtransferase
VDSWEDGAVNPALAAKRSDLGERLSALGRVMVAYSGGVDSSVVMAAAHEALGDRAVAVTAVSPSLARRELESAKALSAERGWRHELVATHEVAREEYARNDPDRCYWCKSELFSVLEPKAAATGAALAVGTNTDDLDDHRPGLRAAQERGVLAPLVDAGLSKAEVRALAADLGLPTADKPASPCLSSRFAYGVRVTAQGLRRVERAEEIVRGHGFSDLRVRDHGNLARIEVPLDEVPRARSLLLELSPGLLGLGYEQVEIDLRGLRSGSLNEVLAAPRIAPSP